MQAEKQKKDKKVFYINPLHTYAVDAVVMTERSHKKVELSACVFRKMRHTAICSDKEQLTQKPKMKTKSSVNAEIKNLTLALAGYVSTLTTQRSTLTEEESATLSARANEAMLRLMVLQGELNG